MNNLVTFLILLITINLAAQSKETYLKNNRYNLKDPAFSLPQKQFKIIGFGAYHGSIKTEEAEFHLLQSLLKNNQIHYYLPETDFSTAAFFNTFLKTGDTLLLKELVVHYGTAVPQERTLETYKKWQRIKTLNDHLQATNKLTVVGINKIADYTFTAKHLLKLIDKEKNASKSIQKIETLVQNDTLTFSAFFDSDAKKILKDFVNNYQQHKSEFKSSIKDTIAFLHIIKNLEETFSNKQGREKTIYQNYMDLKERYHFDVKPQFLRFGFFHLEKSREGKMGNPSFFTMLIENNTYKKEEVLSIIGYLTKSSVLWDEIYDDKGIYKGYTTKKGFGIGDYWKEYFRGIKELKKTKISDITLFRLNNTNSPYTQNPDLIEVKLFLKKSNGEKVKGMNTLDFLDYAILISNSKANTPIQEMNTPKIRLLKP